MDVISLVSQWKGREVVAFSGPVKYRGILQDVIEDGFLVLTKAAIMNASVNETAEYETCVINTDEISGLAHGEIVGRGGDVSDMY